MTRWWQVVAVSALTLVPAGMVSCDDAAAPPPRPVGSDGNASAGSSSNNGGRPAAPPNDLRLVERVLQARKEYQAALESLREFYVRQNDTERKAWVEDELLTYHRISKRAYRLDLDVPPPSLKAEFNVPEANELYRRAMAYKENRGWAVSNQAGDNLRRAEILLQQLLTNHPQSDKIDDAAYHLGDVYENAVFKQYRRAASYFERCCEWNPNTDTDARLRAARIYDKTLHDQTRAIRLYREVVQRDGQQRRVDEATKRLVELKAQPAAKSP